MAEMDSRVDGSGTFSRVLLATDGSPDAALAARKAVAISKGTGAELHVVHVWNEIHTTHFSGFVRHELERRGREVLADAVRRVEEIGGRVAGEHLAVGRTVEGILEVQKNIGADVIIAGSRGMGAVRTVIMGSVSMELARRAPCPVLVVHGEEKGAAVSETGAAAESGAR
ncbi:MAG: universal stress protein [Rubrobacteraceae bacterium]